MENIELLKRAQAQGENYHQRITIDGHSYYVIVEQGDDLLALDQFNHREVEKLANAFFTAHIQKNPKLDHRDITHITREGFHFENASFQESAAVNLWDAMVRALFLPQIRLIRDPKESSDEESNSGSSALSSRSSDENDVTRASLTPPKVRMRHPERSSEGSSSDFQATASFNLSSESSDEESEESSDSSSSSEESLASSGAESSSRAEDSRSAASSVAEDEESGESSDSSSSAEESLASSGTESSSSAEDIGSATSSVAASDKQSGLEEDFDLSSADSELSSVEVLTTATRRRQANQDATCNEHSRSGGIPEAGPLGSTPQQATNKRVRDILERVLRTA